MAAALLFLAGCAGDVGRLVGAGTFNAELLREGGIVVGGVSSASPQTLQQSIDYAGELERTFRRHAPDMAIIGTREVYQALGKNLFSQMLDSYRFHETGSTVFMTLLHEKFPDTRYVVYVRIESGDVQHGDEKTEDGRGLILHTVRGLGVSMRVFDLHARQLQVWAAGTQQGGVTERRVFGDVSEQKLKTLYPKPPKLAPLFEKTCDVLVAELTADD